jgi:thiol:disulfide interchange protein
MSLGVIAFWLAVGSVLGLSNKFVAGSQLFGIWWFAMGIGVFIFSMGLGMLGVFDVGLPNWIYSLNPKHDSAAGSFGFGVLTAVLALPCVAPFMGTAMSWALGRPFGITLATFGAIGVGMALPYAILSIAPKLVAWLPRTGPASDLLKQIMGLLMMAIAVFFIATGIASLTSSKPYLSSVLHWWLIAIMVLGTSIWLVMRTFAITKKPARRGVFALLALLLAGTSFVWARAQTDAAFKEHIWTPYTPEAYKAAKESGKTIVMDFTAIWCLNCKTLKATVLNRDQVTQEILKPHVAIFKVDLTDTESPNWDFLKANGATGIPLLVIEGPGNPEPWRANSYTISNVLDALAAASKR